MSPRLDIRRLAIVNRGEAAMRCLRAVKSLRALEGSEMQAIALYTEVERDAPFVRHADLAVPLRPAATEVASYLDHDSIVEALRRGGADAVWPGWGFVAEDPDFVARLEGEGIAFLGPPAAAMRALGDKIAAKRLAESCGVPVSPWSGGEVDGEESAHAHAERIGFPVVIKAAAGGGGRGIRVVAEAGALGEALRSARAEAASAFGDGRLLVERKVERGRHVEVQIAADRHGEVLALGCRDCSVQRRHQKLIEESPPPALAPELLASLRGDAVRLARAAGYVGLGTVEFLVAGEGYWFLEVNPRLQVEHGVTEMVTGLDLVQLQIRIARGEGLAGLEVRERGCAVEARVCADDPAAGFAPAPGRIARFDVALGPGLRLDTGVLAGSLVPAAFDSLIAKVIAAGDSRQEALARLTSALADFDLVIEGGATNKGYLLDVLAHPEFGAGGVDVGWLERSGLPAASPNAAEGLIAASILAYQRARAAARLNFYADTSNVELSRVPPSNGQQIALDHGGELYRLEVFAIGSWRYRVILDERAIAVGLREEGGGMARLQIGAHTLRVVYDSGEAGVRLEIDGRPLRFGWDAAGHVRAGAPAIVVGIEVSPGTRVEAGQALGLLEAMKMEISFAAPVAGVVTEVRVRKGQQVRAGDVLVVIDPGAAQAEEVERPGEPDGQAEPAARARLRLPHAVDPLAPLFTAAGELIGEPDLAAAAAAAPAQRGAAVEAVREEVRRVLLGYDADPGRAERLVALLEAPLPDRLTASFRGALAELRHEVRAFADVEQLFLTTPSLSPRGEAGPSNNARLRMFVRRLRARGAGLAPEFLERMRVALAHYGVRGLDPGDALERAVLRLLASQRSPVLRHRLVLAAIRHVTALARSGVELGEDRALLGALGRIAAMRGLVPHTVADAAAEAVWVIHEQPQLEAQAQRAAAEIDAWLQAAGGDPPEAVLRGLAEAPGSIFERVGGWLSAGVHGAAQGYDLGRRAIALEVHLRRLYGGSPRSRASAREQGLALVRLIYAGGREVLGCACAPERVAEAVSRLRVGSESPRASDAPPPSQELFVTLAAGHDAAAVAAAVRAALAASVPPGRFTLTLIGAGGARHFVFVDGAGGWRVEAAAHGLHPEAAARAQLERLALFDLDRCEAADDVLCFHARSRGEPGDERLFVVARIRGPSAPGGTRELVPAFERALTLATRTLRAALAQRDPERRLQWNRITVLVDPEVMMTRAEMERIARRMAPQTSGLGLEKVVVSLALVDRRDPSRTATATEIVAADLTGSSLEIRWRAPDRAPVAPRSDYERRVADARRRRLVYPYEIVRMLSGEGQGPVPAGRFEEYDLEPGTASPPRAIPVAGRAPGRNPSAVVFGVISTPTDKVPEGMRRLLILSDPTRGMGALAAPECDRIVAALDLAEAERLPVEWVPVSSGARIAMDSGTENLDATARVARRIVTFTQRGGVIHVIVGGVNVGAQSYWNALATMLLHTRGALIMTAAGSMVLTGRAALEASGSVSAEDEIAIGGFERVMGPNGEAQYFAADLPDAFRLLHQHYRYTYVVPGEAGPRPFASTDARQRPLDGPANGGSEFRRVAEIFDDDTNPGRKRSFPMRAVMAALVDRDGGWLERWRAWAGAETAIVWDAHLGGMPICLLGIESQNLEREGYRPLDGPPAWSGGTLFPQSSKKVARALNAASGNRPVVLLANLSGFDGSPESMRKLQLEYGAEIARAVVNFDGPLLFLVVSRYHGGAYVVFSRALNPGLEASALSGTYASVIGGSAAAAVVFAREVRARAAADPRLRALRDELRHHPGDAARARLEQALQAAESEAQAAIAAEFDAVHSVERALAVGSLAHIVEPRHARAFLIERLEAATAHEP